VLLIAFQDQRLIMVAVVVLEVMVMVALVV
jgi:hypothetical protein